MLEQSESTPIGRIARGSSTRTAAALMHLGNRNYYLLAWILAVLIIVPWSIRELIQIYKDEWLDIPIDESGVTL